MQDSELGQINKFWQEVIDGWILSDIERMVSFEPVKNENGNLNFAIALVCFAGIELLGRLMLGVKKENGKANFREFIKTYFPKSYKEEIYSDSELLNFLYDNFRSGLAHNFLTEKQTGISRRDDPHLEFEIHKGGPVFIVNADIFFYHFKIALKEYRKDLDEDKKDDNNFRLKGNFIKYLRNQSQEVNEEVFQKLITKYIKPTTTTTTSSSSASISQERLLETTTLMPESWIDKSKNKK